MSERAGTNWGKVIAIVGSVFGVIAIAICAAGSLLIGMCESMLEGDPQQQAQFSLLDARMKMHAFLARLERGDVDGARQDVSNVFLAAWPEGRLVELSERLRGMGERDFGDWSDIAHVDPGSYADAHARKRLKYELRADYAKGELLFRFELARQENGGWRIDYLEVGE